MHEQAGCASPSSGPACRLTDREPIYHQLSGPLVGITEEMIQGGAVLEARIPGTGKDGGPSCATVKSFGGWKTPRDANKA